MKCRKCGSSNVRIVNSRPVYDETQRRRRYLCLECNQRFWTMERYESKDVAPIRHAHWVVYTENRTGNTQLRCSECMRTTFEDCTPTPFCPLCGAEMENGW